MKRTTLREYLQRLLVVSLPLASFDCSSNNNSTFVCQIDDLGSGTQFFSRPIDVDSGAKDCREICPPYSQALNLGQCEQLSTDGGVENVACTYYPRGCGRKPAGLAPVAYISSQSALGQYFAQAAHMEAASVFAFQRLARELVAHDGPSALIQAAETAAEDETRHAALMLKQAERFGARMPAVTVRRIGTRSLEEIAIENAVEGCVGETFGALLAAWQIKMTPDSLGA